jgi:membrane fusion protein (multidrug efflux system)
MDEPAKEMRSAEKPEDLGINMQADGQRPDMSRETRPNNHKDADSISKSGGIRSWIPKSRRNRWMLLVGLAVAGLAILEVWRYFGVRESTDDAKIDGYIVPVSARIKGTVVAVNVEDNQYVKAGTLLVQMDAADYEIALANTRADLAAAQADADAARTGVPVERVSSTSQVHAAEASLRQAQTGVEAAQTQVESAEASLAAAQARLREAHASYVKAEQDVNRFTMLIVKSEISQQQYDAAVAAAKVAKAVSDSAEAMVKASKDSVDKAQAQLRQAQSIVPKAKAGVQAARTAPQRVAISRAQAEAAEAKVLQAKAAVDQAQLNLRYTSVVAMADGVVSNRTVQLGQVVQPGEVLLAIAPIENLWVTANFKETQLKNVRPGQRAFVSVDALGGCVFLGRVASIAGATSESFSLLPSENATGNFVKVVQRIPVKIIFEKGQDAEHRLRVGMSVEPTIIIN